MLDKIYGKAACVLLVLIMAAGAFLAPRVINNLYDKGTLGQIEYMDMNMSTYEVAYSDFGEKLEAIGTMADEGAEFFLLRINESPDAVSDEELTEAVKREIGKLTKANGLLYREGWWTDLTTQNLTLREKDTIYVQRSMGGEEGKTLQNMLPAECWVLTYEMTEAQTDMWIKEFKDEWRSWAMTDEGEEIETVYDFEIMETKREMIPKRLSVILDADFYKIYAASLSETVNGYIEEYGIDLWMFMGDAEDNAKAMGIYAKDIQHMVDEDITEYLAAAWINYWGIRPDAEAVKEIEVGNAGASMLRTEVFSRTADGDNGEGRASLDVGFRIEGEKKYESLWKRKYMIKYGLGNFFDMLQF